MNQTKENKQIKEGPEDHHPFCNYFAVVGPCKWCDNYYKKFPIIENMMEYFPDAVPRTEENK